MFPCCCLSLCQEGRPGLGKHCSWPYWAEGWRGEEGEEGEGSWVRRPQCCRVRRALWVIFTLCGGPPFSIKGASQQFCGYRAQQAPAQRSRLRDTLAPSDLGMVPCLPGSMNSSAVHMRCCSHCAPLCPTSAPRRAYLCSSVDRSSAHGPEVPCLERGRAAVKRSSG